MPGMKTRQAGIAGGKISLAIRAVAGRARGNALAPLQGQSFANLVGNFVNGGGRLSAQ